MLWQDSYITLLCLCGYEDDQLNPETWFGFENKYLPELKLFVMVYIF